MGCNIDALAYSLFPRLLSHPADSLSLGAVSDRAVVQERSNGAATRGPGGWITATRRVVLSANDYVAGRLPLTGWSDGEVVLRLLTGLELVCGGRRPRSKFWGAMTTVLWTPLPLVLDGNCISYWLDTLDFTTEPEAMDGLRDQKLALVRMFFYWPSGTLSVVARGRDEVESITDPKRLQKHQQWMDVHLTELPRLGATLLRRSLKRLGKRA